MGKYWRTLTDLYCIQRRTPSRMGAIDNHAHSVHLSNCAPSEQAETRICGFGASVRGEVSCVVSQQHMPDAASIERLDAGQISTYLNEVLDIEPDDKLSRFSPTFDFCRRDPNRQPVRVLRCHF